MSNGKNLLLASVWALKPPKEREANVSKTLLDFLFSFWVFYYSFVYFFY